MDLSLISNTTIMMEITELYVLIKVKTLTQILDLVSLLIIQQEILTLLYYTGTLEIMVMIGNAIQIK